LAFGPVPFRQYSWRARSSISSPRGVLPYPQTHTYAHEPVAVLHRGYFSPKYQVSSKFRDPGHWNNRQINSVPIDPVVLLRDNGLRSMRRMWYPRAQADAWRRIRIWRAIWWWSVQRQWRRYLMGLRDVHGAARGDHV
jgi:hypothetical protein